MDLVDLATIIGAIIAGMAGTVSAGFYFGRQHELMVQTMKGMAKNTERIDILWDAMIRRATGEAVRKNLIAAEE